MRPRGFTLIEVMVVVSIVAILATVAAPSFRGLIAGQRIKAAAYDLHTDMIFARSEAIKRNASVTLAPNAEGWSSGWSVTTGGATLKSRQLPASTLSLAGSAASVVFNGAGRPSTTFQATAADTGIAVTARCIQLDLSGRPSTRSGECGT